MISAGLTKAELCLEEFDRIKGSSKFLARDQVSLADLYTAPLIAYLSLKLLGEHKGRSARWEAMAQRSSFKATEPKMG